MIEDRKLVWHTLNDARAYIESELDDTVITWQMRDTDYQASNRTQLAKLNAELARRCSLAIEGRQHDS